MYSYLLIALLFILPQRLLSRFVGFVVRLKMPRLLQIPANQLFVRTFQIDMSESKRHTNSFSCIEDLFVRELRDGLRVARASVCSPADGRLTVSMPTSDSAGSFAIKGHQYSAAELVTGNPSSPLPSPLGWASVVYLAPHNYHRVHSPVSGTLISARYIKGRLWPVIPAVVEKLPNLFSLNERLVFDIKLSTGETAHIVMVGAMNVGRMLSHLLPNFVTNVAALPSQKEFANINHEIRAGDELGIFQLGSTVVMLLPAKYVSQYSFVQLDMPRPIIMGEPIIAN
jgi:phosphatidylserine decarboxylase